MMIFFSGGGFREDWLILRVKLLQGLVGLGGTRTAVRLCPEQSRKRTDRWVVIWEKSVRGRNPTSHKLTASDWTGMVSDARRKKKGYNQKSNGKLGTMIIIIIIMFQVQHTLVP